MKEILNPYIAGAPVVETSMFFGREDIFDWIERNLAGKYVDHILVLHGQRRVGKTSVLKQIPNFLPEKYIQVFFDLQGRTNTTLDRFLWWLAREITRTLKQELYIDIPRPNRVDFSTNPEYLIQEFLPWISSLLDGQMLLLTFDEFDTLTDPSIQDSLSKPLIAYLRRLMENKTLNFIFSIGSSGNKLEHMQAAYTDFFKAALYRKISFLTKDDCTNLITQPVSGVLSYDTEAVDRIFEVTSGHPYFVQLVCHELFSMCQETGKRNISRDDVENILYDVVERGTVNLKFVWDEASTLQKWVLTGLAQFNTETTIEKLSQLLREQQVRFTEADLNSAVIYLRDKDVITEKNQFAIYLMRMWMQSNRPFERVREELSEVNPIISRNLELGQEYQANSRFTEAIECFNTTLEEDPDNLDAQLGLGECYLGAGNVDQSIEVFTNLLENFGESIRVQLGYCKAYMALGDAEAALEHWEVARAAFLRVLEVNPQHRSATEELVRIFRLQIVQALLEGDIQKTQALLFEAYEKSGKPEEFGIYSTAVQEMSVSDDVRFEILESLSEKEYNREHWDEGYLIDSYLAQQHPETPMDSDRMQSNRQKAQAVLVGKLNHWARTYTDAGEYEKALSFWRRLLEFDLPESDRILKTIHQLEADHIIEPAAPALGNIWRYLILGIVLVGAVVAALVFIPGAPLNSLIVIPEFGEAVLQTDIPTEMASKKRTTVPIGENIVVTSSQDREEGSLQPGTLTDTPTDKPTNIASEEATTVPIEDTIIVTSAQDSGEGSLRQALLHARRGHTITFDPEIFPPGNPTTIFLTSDDLPTISQGGITIDASNAGVILDGSKLGSGEYFGLVLRSDHNTVMGLQIINFDSIGIYLEGGSYNMIGGDRTIGTGPLGQGNLLGKNYAGIDLLSFSGGNVIKGNLIGTDVSGAWPRANMKSGIWVEDNQSYSSVANTIGPDNIIAYNGKTEAVQNGEYTGGIVIDAVKLSTVITANSIYDNTGPGIYYNPKDASLYTYPTSPIIYNYDLDTNTVNGQACAGCVVEIFSTDTQDGKIFEGTTTADTDGNYSFSKGEAFIGPFLTATALSLGESTSEFSQPAPAIFPVQMALDVIQNKEPLYQTSFDTWDFAEPQENASIENGKLIVNSEDQTWVSLDKFNFYSDRFAVEFALQLLEPQHNASCSLNFEPSLDASIKHGLRIMFLRSGEVRVDHPVTPGEGEDVVIGSGRFNPSKSSTFTLIILNNQFIFFVNGELVFTALDPDGSNVYEHGAIEASLPITCEFDSYRFWDLQSMELDQ